jgi:hypothetical protein
MHSYSGGSSVPYKMQLQKEGSEYKCNTATRAPSCLIRQPMRHQNAGGLITTHCCVPSRAQDTGVHSAQSTIITLTVSIAASAATRVFHCSVAAYVHALCNNR